MAIPKLPPPPLMQAKDTILARWCSDLYQQIKAGLIGGGSASPLTTKGDVYTRDATADARLAVGSNGQVLMADSVATTGNKWKTLAESDVTNLTSDLATLATGVSGSVPTSRTISTTAPITGGGDLSANLTLAISDFTGDSGSGGAKGTVPAPAAGDAAAKKFLKASGAWSAIAESDVTSLTTDLAAKLTNPMTTKGDIIYGDTSGVPTRLAASTAGLVLATNGAGTAPSYQSVGTIALPLWIQQHPDSYPLSPSADDDEFDAGSISGSWTAINAAGTMVFTEANGKLIATPTSDPGGAIRGYYKALPSSGSWEYRIKCYFDPSSTSTSNVMGFMLLESATGKMDAVYYGRFATSDIRLKFEKWISSGTAFGSTGFYDQAVPGAISMIYFLVSFDGTTYSFKASQNGVVYFTFLTRTATSDFTTKADRIMLGRFSNQSGAADPGYWEYFRKTI